MNCQGCETRLSVRNLIKMSNTQGQPCPACECKYAPDKLPIRWWLLLVLFILLSTFYPVDGMQQTILKAVFMGLFMATSHAMIEFVILLCRVRKQKTLR